MMKQLILNRIFLLLLLSFSAIGAQAQEASLFGHYLDFQGYYNPALNKKERLAEIGLMHRSQWAQLGYPVSNLLFFKFSPKKEPSFMGLNSIGLMGMYEDINYLNRSNVNLFSSHHLAGNRYYSLSLGVTAGIQLEGIDMSGLNPREMADPKIAQTDGSRSFRGKVGMSYRYEHLTIGVASSIHKTDMLDDLIVTGSHRFDLSASDLSFIPVVMMRLSSNNDEQVEVQLRSVYNNRVALALGYRQDFGAIFQVGFVIGKAKGSYSAELPKGDESAFGVTHEFFASFKFDMQSDKKAEQDSILQAKQDSLLAVKLDSIRQLRVAKQEQKRDTVIVEVINIIEAAPEVSETVENVEILEEKIISFDQIDTHIHRDTSHVILEHIGFETGYDILKPYAFNELDRLVLFLKHNKHFNIEIQGHTDNSGSETTNNELSYRRALVVRNYLISRGIDPGKMKAVGYGETKPLYPNDTEEHKELNRRIEIVFVKE